MSLRSKALIAGALLEAFPLAASLWALIEGGAHGGGSIFNVTHLPSSALLAPLISAIPLQSRAVEVLFVAFVALAQAFLYSVVSYGAFWLERARHRA
jgi:hypothetical protein